MCRDDYHFTPLHLAAQTDAACSAAAFLAAGANISDTNKHGCTPLHAAAISGSIGVISVLLRHRADITANQCTVQGSRMTPLQVASYFGHQAVVAALLEAGANPRDVVGGDGVMTSKSSLEVAVARGFHLADFISRL